MTYYGFNVHGRPVTVQYSAGNGVIYTYDLFYDHPRARGNVLQIRRKPDMTLPPDDTTDLITNMTYESNFNQIKTVTDPKGNLTTYTYDYELDPADPHYGTAGNLVRITYPTVGTQTPEINYTYNQYGQVTRVEDPNGNVTEYDYDAATGLVSRIVQDPGGINAQTLFTYDSYLNIDTITDPDLHTTYFTYNEIGWLIDTTNDLGYVTRYDYDQNGNVIHIFRQADASGTTWQTWSYTYNALNKLVTVTDPLFRVSTYAYDGEENLIYVRDFENNVTTYDYDERNLLYKVTDANSPAGETYYDYDLNGNLSRILDAENHETIYEYDDFDRLETTRFPDLSETTLAYDKNSNLIDTVLPDTLHIEYVYDALNRVTNKSFPSHPGRNVAYAYDPGSRLTAVSTASADINFSYDNANRVLSATQTISGLASKTVQYGYDASGNRSQVIYPSGRTLDYTYDGINRLTDIEQNSAPLAHFDYDVLKIGRASCRERVCYVV